MVQHILFQSLWGRGGAQTEGTVVPGLSHYGSQSSPGQTLFVGCLIGLLNVPAILVSQLCHKMALSQLCCGMIAVS